jgi:putative Mg2+ transporter-C (MgtC) family protein
MEFIKEFSLNAILKPEINIWNMFVRVVLSICLGALIGYKQESRGRPAGFRTHISITLGACLIMMLSIYIGQHFGSDPARIAAQIVSGIGFLGAGAIIKSGFNVLGLTTAASIWVMAGIGMIVGCGMYILSISGTVFIFITLNFLRKLEKKFFKRRKSQSKIKVVMHGVLYEKGLKQINDLLKNYKVKPVGISFSTIKDKNETIIKVNVRQPRNIEIFDIMDKLSQIKNVKSVDLKTL